MPASELVYALMLILLVLVYINGYYSLKALKRKQAYLREELSRHWREHKDDHHEMLRKHGKLVDALGMKEVSATPSHYAKEQQ